MSFATLAKATFLFLLEFPLSHLIHQNDRFMPQVLEGMPLPQISALLRGFCFN